MMVTLVQMLRLVVLNFLPNTVLKDLVNLKLDDDQEVYFLDAPQELYQEELTKRLLDFDQQIMDSTTHGCTACMVLAQPWDLVNDKAITEPMDEQYSKFNFANKDTIGIKLFTMNIGDSRAILIKYQQDDPRDITFDALSQDHKPLNPIEAQRIHNAGGFVQMDRVDGNLALSRAIGDSAYKNATDHTLGPREQKVIAVPDFTTTIAHYGDLLFLACDGIFEAEVMKREAVAALVYDVKQQQIKYYKQKYNVDDDAIAELLFEPAEIGRELIQESIALGSHDNHTAIVISFTSFNTAKDATIPLLNTLKDTPRFEIVPSVCTNEIEQTYTPDIQHSHLHKFMTAEEWEDLLPSDQRINVISRKWNDLEEEFHQDNTAQQPAEHTRLARFIDDLGDRVNVEFVPSPFYKDQEAMEKELTDLNQALTAQHEKKPLYTLPLFLHNAQASQTTRTSGWGFRWYKMK
eukprot:UN00752